MKRTLAIMAKAPREGHVKTRLAAVCPPLLAVQLYRALIEDTIALGNDVGANVAIVCPTDDAEEITAWLPSSTRVVAQRGTGLADALTSVFEIFCDGSRPVVAFNGDSPHLSPGVLASAFVALEKHDVALGPCEDGGYFLVGAVRPHAGLFDQRAMGTGSALEALIANTRQLGLSLALTERHYDVDVPADLARLARDLEQTPERAPRTALLLAEWKSNGALSP